MAAIFDSPVTLTSEIIHISPTVLLGLENVGQPLESRFRVADMPTCYGDPCAGCSNRSWSWENPGAGRNMQQEISVAQHVNYLLVSCAQSLFVLRIFRHSGLPADALHTVFQATAVAKLSCASPAWWGFISAADRDRQEAFLRRSTVLGFRPATAPTLSTMINTVRGDHNQLVSSSPSSLATQARHSPFVEAPCSRFHSFNSNFYTYSDNNFLKSEIQSSIVVSCL